MKKNILFPFVFTLICTVLYSINVKADSVYNKDPAVCIKVDDFKNNLVLNRQSNNVIHLKSTKTANSYKLSKSGSGWYVSYKVKVKNNKISEVYDLKSLVYIGSLVDSALSQVNSRKVKWTGKHKLGLFVDTVSCTAKIKDRRLIAN